MTNKEDANKSLQQPIIYQILYQKYLIYKQRISQFLFQQRERKRERDASEIIDNIHNLLNQSIENVNSADYKNAESLVIAAYLDNFEFIEGDIAKHDESLMKDTEVLLR